jgi:integrase
MKAITAHSRATSCSTNKGKPIQPKRDWRAWRHSSTRHRPPEHPSHVALHAARNTAASLLEAAGVPDRLVAQILGHSQVHITHGYQTADDARVRAAMMAYEGLLELD